MNTARTYARALFALIEEKPKSASLYMSNLGRVLERRGHTRLLQAIFNEYRMLTLAKERAALHRQRTPQQEQTRILLELYRKLTHTV